MNENSAKLKNISKIALISGVIAFAAFAFAWFKNPADAAYSYLPAWVFWFGITVGSFALTMIHHLTSGGWGYVIRRIQLNVLAVGLPVCAVLFLPIGLSLHHLYLWTDKAAVAHDAVLTAKAIYLNLPFFWVRFAIYFAIWIWLAAKLKKHSDLQDQKPTYEAAFKLAGYGGGGLILYSLTVTFALIDWVMSLEPHWFSTMYGAIFMVTFSLSSLAFCILTAVFVSKNGSMEKVLTTNRLHDLGTLLFANTMLWAYTSIAQFIIIWSGNLKEEVVWFLHRNQNGWWYVIAVIFVLHFLLPFFLLLMRFIKRKAARLVKVAALLLFIRWVELMWYTKPTHFEHVTFSWVDIAAWIAVGGIWLHFVANRLANNELTFKQDPIYSEEHH